MVNICFCETLAGILKIHLGTNKKKHDVIYFNLHLNYGELSDGVFSDKRIRETNSVFCEEWLYQPLFTRSYIRHIKKAICQISKLLKKREHIRIWFDGSANEYCSFLYLISIFSQYWEQISFVNAENMGFDDLIFVPWLEIDPFNIEQFIAAEQQLTENFALAKVFEWKEICSNNSPLRVFENGSIKGVPIDYYDPIIESVIPIEEYSSDLVFRDLLNIVGNKIPYELLLNRLSHIIRNGNYRITHITKKSKNTNQPYIQKIRFTKQV